MSKEVSICVYRRAEQGAPIEQVHSKFISNLKKSSDLIFKDIDWPATPECGDSLIASYGFNHPRIDGVSFSGHYIFRGESHLYDDKASYDDFFSVRLEFPIAEIAYSSLLLETLPELICAFEAYRAIVTIDTYDVKLVGLSSNRDPVYSEILKTGRDMNGRDNIFTLRPAQYWDETLCKKALGYGPEEVISRLKSSAPKVEKLSNGVFLVLSTDLELTLEQYLDMNRTFKALLNLR
ncbi:MAG: hypothetical protein U0103_10365 [Candidatus Obscuribacterales bacterium]